MRVQFDPGRGHGTAVFMIDLAREPGGTVDAADRHEVLLRANAVAESSIDYVKKEVPASRPEGEKLCLS